MRKLVYLAMYIALIGSPALAGSSNFNGSDGSYLGTMSAAGRNSNFIYGQDGSLVGSTVRAENGTFVYRDDGSYAGQATNSYVDWD